MKQFMVLCLVLILGVIAEGKHNGHNKGGHGDDDKGGKGKGRQRYSASLYDAADVLQCYGTIINDRWILADASCVNRNSIQYATVGIDQTDQYDIIKIILYPHWTKNSHEHDYAILKTKRPIKFYSRVKWCPDDLVRPFDCPKCRLMLFSWMTECSWDN